MLANIDKRISYKIVLDTETAPLDRTYEEVSPFNMWVYDIGWVVTDKRGKIYEARSYVVADIYLHEKEIMSSAYYAQKLPQYEKDINAGVRILARLTTIRKVLLQDIENYGVQEVYAHNTYFDMSALNNTQRWLTKSQFRYFFPYGIKLCDTMKMVQSMIAKRPTYIAFCKEHGYLTKRGVPRVTAEVVFRYMTGDLDFNEEHTGLADVMIEKEIMAYCYRQHKPMIKYLFNEK